MLEIQRVFEGRQVSGLEERGEERREVESEIERVARPDRQVQSDSSET